MRGLVLSLFPGADLLGLAFEEAGFSVVHGPDAIFGRDVRGFHVPSGVFDGVIGGPPCQIFSTASAISGTDAVDLVPEYFRLIEEAQPRWALMENVPSVIRHPAIPSSWYTSVLRDWDCGGLTSRRRLFASTFPIPAPPRRRGVPSHSVLASTAGKGKRKEPWQPGDAGPAPSVMATTWKRGRSASRYVADKSFLPGDLPVMEYARLQGAEVIGRALDERRSSKAFTVTLLGNGVPLALGRYVASYVPDRAAEAAS